jgi:ribosomal protein L7/L12
VTRPTRKVELPTAAHLALQEGRLIDAIKIVREAKGIGLAEAKARIDAAVAADPALSERVAQQRKKQRTRWIVWVLIFDAVVIAAAIIWWFRR